MINIQFPNQVTVKNPQDPHLHWRGYLENHFEDWDEQKQADTNAMMNLVLPMNKNFSRILAMPNTIPQHIQTKEDLDMYKQMVEKAMPLDKYFTETMFVVSLTDQITAKSINELKGHIKGVKYYPWGVTTNSGGSSADIDINKPQTREVLEAMQDNNIVLNLHPETTLQKDHNGAIEKGFVHDAEREFSDIVVEIAEQFPKLKIVIEHISTFDMVEIIESWKYPNVYGSVTPQHLMLTAHDKEGGPTFDAQVHCKPTLKTPKDLEAIQRLVLSGNPNIYFWSDSAPHPTEAKESSCCSAWAFSSPVAIETITDWFFRPETIRYWLEKELLSETWYLNELQDKLQAFIWDNANNVYWTPKFDKQIVLERKPFEVPKHYGDTPRVVPFNHWEELQYSVLSAKANIHWKSIDLLQL